MCVLVSDCRIFKAFTKGVITFRYSVRKAISAELNLYEIRANEYHFSREMYYEKQINNIASGNFFKMKLYHITFSKCFYLKLLTRGHNGIQYV